MGKKGRGPRGKGASYHHPGMLGDDTPTYIRHMRPHIITQVGGRGPGVRGGGMDEGGRGGEGHDG